MCIRPMVKLSQSRTDFAVKTHIEGETMDTGWKSRGPSKDQPQPNEPETITRNSQEHDQVLPNVSSLVATKAHESVFVLDQGK